MYFSIHCTVVHPSHLRIHFAYLDLGDFDYPTIGTSSKLDVTFIVTPELTFYVYMQIDYGCKCKLNIIYSPLCDEHCEEGWVPWVN